MSKSIKVRCATKIDRHAGTWHEVQEAENMNKAIRYAQLWEGMHYVEILYPMTDGSYVALQLVDRNG